MLRLDIQGCVTAPLVCDDGSACTTDACGPTECTFAAVDCDDGDSCTVDACAGATGSCFYVAIPGCVSDAGAPPGTDASGSDGGPGPGSDAGTGGGSEAGTDGGTAAGSDGGPGTDAGTGEPRGCAYAVGRTPGPGGEASFALLLPFAGAFALLGRRRGRRERR